MTAHWTDVLAVRVSVIVAALGPAPSPTWARRVEVATHG
jgi:hypothetical protein